MVSLPSGTVTFVFTDLHELREDGALTEEQYRRMVERLLDGEG